MKFSRWVALSLALGLLLVGAVVASAFPYSVHYGDTLFSLARRYNTSVDAIVEANDIADPDVIYADQMLEIPGEAPAVSVAASAPAPMPVASAPSSGSGSYVVQQGDTLYSIAAATGTSVDTLAQANAINNVNYIRVGQTLVVPGEFGDLYAVTPLSSNTARLGVNEGTACARINFLAGLDSGTGSRGAGTYVISEYNGRGGLAMWKAEDGDVDSGWIENVKLTFPSVHVVVTFYPADDSAPVVMDIVNPGSSEGFGWLSRGVCSAIEVQFPR